MLPRHPRLGVRLPGCRGRCRARRAKVHAARRTQAADPPPGTVAPEAFEAKTWHSLVACTRTRTGSKSDGREETARRGPNRLGTRRRRAVSRAGPVIRWRCITTSPASSPSRHQCGRVACMACHVPPLLSPCGLVSRRAGSACQSKDRPSGRRPFAKLVLRAGVLHRHGEHEAELSAPASLSRSAVS